jgi:hypothetical protein
MSCTFNPRDFTQRLSSHQYPNNISRRHRPTKR